MLDSSAGNLSRPDIILSYEFPPGNGDYEERMTTFTELKQRLEQIRDDQSDRTNIPLSVDLIKRDPSLKPHDTPERLVVGLGNSEWIVTYFSADDEVVLYSLGNIGAEGTTVFMMCQWTELSRKYLVPRDKAWEVVRVWFEEGRLSDAIEWTDQMY